YLGRRSTRHAYRTHRLERGARISGRVRAHPSGCIRISAAGIFSARPGAAVFRPRLLHIRYTVLLLYAPG
ncbi:Tranposon-transfer assisting protein, partial [Dysosmobacter welbionis]